MCIYLYSTSVSGIVFAALAVCHHFAQLCVRYRYAGPPRPSTSRHTDPLQLLQWLCVVTTRPYCTRPQHQQFTSTVKENDLKSVKTQISFNSTVLYTVLQSTIIITPMGRNPNLNRSLSCPVQVPRVFQCGGNPNHTNHMRNLFPFAAGCRDTYEAPHVAALGRTALREARELRGRRFLEALWAEWNPRLLVSTHRRARRC